MTLIEKLVLSLFLILGFFTFYLAKTLPSPNINIKKEKIEKIEIEFIDHKNQRYDTAGDYYLRGNTLIVKISKYKDWRYQWLVMIHELSEVFLVMNKGISFDSIDQFDMSFKGEDPGSDPNAPYHEEHMTALDIERKLCEKSGLNWEEYEDTL